jgi:ABC-2 type transport system permease protein
MSDLGAREGANATGVIHDIGYQRYTGPRLGRAYAVRSLYTHGVRTAFGLGRSAGAKAFPWAVFGLMMVIAAIIAAIQSQSGPIVKYWEFPTSGVALLVILFCAVVAPELVSRDQRGGVLPLYFSRPLTRTDYALAKWAALITAAVILLLAPLLLIFTGAAFSVDSLSAFWTEFVQFTKGVAVSLVEALVFASLAMLVASLASRRAVAAAMIVAVFLITTPVYGVLMGLAYRDSDRGELTGGALKLFQLAGLVSPTTLAGGVGKWLYDPERPLGDYGPLYGVVALALIVISVLLLLLRYRKVAR